MSQIVPVSQDNEDDILAQLAAEFGIEAETDSNSGGNRLYTPLTRVDNIRVMNNKSWQDGKFFQWNIPGEPESTEEFEDIPLIHEIGGIIVHSELQSALTYKEDPNDQMSTKLVCSTLGYKKGEEYMQELPEKVYFSSMYEGWNQEKNQPIFNKPNKNLTADYLGSRGKSCFDCVKCGEAVVRDDDGEVIGDCKLKGRIFIYVTHLIRIKTNKSKDIIREEFTVKQLTGEDGFILMISLPNKVGLKGYWDKDKEENRRQGYLGYLNSLRFKYGKSKPAKTSPRVNYTKLVIKPPVEGTKNTKNFLCFEEVETYDISLRSKGLNLWRELNPNVDTKILDPSDFVIKGSGGTVVYSSASVDNTNGSYLTASKVKESSYTDYEDDDDNIFS